MPKEGVDGWYCKHCNSGPYNNQLLALSCEQAHDIIYVPFKIEDLQRLIQFINTKDDRLLTESLVKTLKKYSSNMRNRWTVLSVIKR